MTTGRYSTIEHEGFREKLGKLEEIEQDVMDLVPEVQLLRTLVIDYVERYEEYSEALIAWHMDGKENTTKPRKVLDIADAGNLIEKISRTVQRIHTIRQSGSITLETFKRVTEAMGIIVAKHVDDGSVLDAIEAEWADLALDARDPGLRPAPKDDEEDDEESE